MPLLIQLVARALGLGAFFFALACKELPEDLGQRHEEVAYRSGPTLGAADPMELLQNNSFYFQVWNNYFTLALDSMPMEGSVPDDKKPWSGSWYPETSGGTDVKASGESALQKYDKVFHGGTNKASAWEREKHNSNVGWAGHCNGLAAFGQRHPTEPSKNVVRSGVTFTPKDIKALMTELHMNADYQFLGGTRCNKSGPSRPESRSDPTIMDACQGVNPGTLHATVANWIGTMKHVVIVDTHPGDQVWNYPVIGYKVLNKDVVSEQEATRAVTGGSKYVFNPAAVKFVKMRTQLYIVNAMSNEVLQTRQQGTVDLSYILELDAVGNIVGGEWTGSSIMQHPNFVWVAFEPLPANGSRSLGNPHLDSKTVIGMWAESIGADPSNPPSDIKRPAQAQAWGELPNFSVTLDGMKSGAAFGGKPINLRLERRGPLAAGGLELLVSLNGQDLPPVATSGGEELVVPVSPLPGLNKLLFQWKQGGNSLQSATLAFNFNP
ncbi:MAG: hypothetical protein FJ146_09035 [Deltaproteobacteria bacterium]|nr:hypothetical protein [Deltaproteobacteria bacterium]